MKKAVLVGMMAVVAFLITACYPLATGSGKWSIRWDKEGIARKEAFLQNCKSEDSNPPNIVLIMADDLGKYEVSAYGAEHIRTPHMDQIGQEGVIFNEGYVTAAICSPSRAGLLTGRYQQRFGFETNIMEFYPTNLIEYLTGKYFVNTDTWVIKSKPQFPREWQVAKQGIPPEEMIISEFFKGFGYQTGIVGKWHVGNHKKNRPENRGFDYQYGFNGAYSLYTPEQHTPGYVFHIQETFSSRHQWESGRSTEGAMYLNGKKIVEEDYLTFAIKDRAIEFMKRNREKPFFLYIPFSAPHVPFQAPIDYYCKYSHVKDENKRVYYAMISALDDAIGEIHQAIKNMGLEENTIIYFLSDNGGATYLDATDNGPLKGGKLTPFEGGINVPFMMKWKGVIPPGTVYDKPVLSLDVFATSAAACNFALPEDRVYDGVNLLPYLSEEKNDSPHPVIFWKAAHMKAIRHGNWKMLKSDRDTWQHLYNLETDKSEENDLEQQQIELFLDLLQQHQDWQKMLPKRPLWPHFMDKRFSIDGMDYLFPA